MIIRRILLILAITTVALVTHSALAETNVVVVPLGGSVGDALASDVVKGKTFSSTKGKGLTGSLDLKVGKIFINSIGMQFRLIPAGSYIIGSPDGTGDTAHRPFWPEELGRYTNETQHVVSITKPFYMQTTEVTQGQWEQIMGSNPSHFESCGSDCPVEMVSWNNAQNFIDALNASEGRTNCNTNPNICYSLPSDAQWEYAARAGTLTAFYNGAITYTDCTLDPNLDAIGWYCGNSDSTTHPVAKKEPNSWGLYDMSGNVFEWCDGYYGLYPDGPLTDPVFTTGTERVFRGGSWKFGSGLARSAFRTEGSSSDIGTDYVGFRLSLPSSP